MSLVGGLLEWSHLSFFLVSEVMGNGLNSKPISVLPLQAKYHSYKILIVTPVTVRVTGNESNPKPIRVLPLPAVSW
jgi:hypothetical protein